MPHQSYKTITLMTLIALVTAHSLSANFDSLIEGLGLPKDPQIATTRSRLSSIFDVKEGPKPPSKKGEKVEIQRSPFEQEILRLHKALVDLGVETHPLDRELWKSFLINMNAFMGVGGSVKPAFRKNQIAELGKNLSRLLESYQKDLVAYFSRETPQMLGKAILATDKIEARYLALFDIHAFMAKYWANDQVDYVAPLMMSAMQLAQAKLIEDIFETEYITQLTQQREERRKIKLEKEKERLK